MGYGIGGGGFAGIAIETTPNTYVPPVKFFPFLSESLKYAQDTQWRRPIRQNVDNLGGVPGNVHTEGDIELEALTDALVYFHRISRASMVKVGASAPFTYTYVGTPAATPVKTASITIVRNGVVFGYAGCVVGNFKYSVDNGQLKATFSIVGSDEAVQTLPTSDYTTNQLQPFGAGEYNIQIPTATQVFDADTFEFSVEDNATPQYRMKNTGRGAQFVSYGERTCTMTTERDFQDRTDYDAYKALTAQSITLKATKTTAEEVSIILASAIKDSYELGLSGQGDLIRGKVTYQSVYNATATSSYSLALKTNDGTLT